MFVLQYFSGRDLATGAGSASVLIFVNDTLSRMNITKAAIRSPNKGAEWCTALCTCMDFTLGEHKSESFFSEKPHISKSCIYIQ